MRGNRKRLTCGYAGNSLAGRGGADGRGLSEYSVSFMIHLETITDREPDVVRHIRHDVALGSVSPLPVAPTIGDVGELDGEVVLESHIGVLHINVRGARDTFQDVNSQDLTSLDPPLQSYQAVQAMSSLLEACIWAICHDPEAAIYRDDN
jgi:hypothetical protein